MTSFRQTLAMLVGVVLVVAAILKLHAISIDVMHFGLYQAFLLLLVMIEVTTGSLLIFGKPTATVYAGAILLFSAFLCYNLATLSLGKYNCECLGVVPQSNWQSILLNLACLAALAFARAAQASDGYRGPMNVRPVILGSSVFVLCVAGLFLCLDALPAVAQLRKEAVRFSGGANVLGTVTPGQQVVANLTVLNKWSEPVTIVGGAAQCRCDPLEDLPVTVPAGEGRSISVRVVAPSVEGKFAVPLRLFTNLEWQPIVRAELKGVVAAKSVSLFTSRKEF